MKRSFYFAAAISLLSTGLVAEEKPDIKICTTDCPGSFPREVVDFGAESIELKNLFAPKGFDANDEPLVMATGFLPSPCWDQPYGIVTKAGDDIKVTIKARKKHSFCITLRTRYLIPVSLGRLPTGSYNIEASTETGLPLFARLGIDPATVGAVSTDDYLYADVSNVLVDNATRTVTLLGNNPSACLKLDRIKPISNGINTYALLPIMKKISDKCDDEEEPFAYPYKLDDELQAPEILIHVRALNGKSHNALLKKL